MGRVFALRNVRIYFTKLGRMKFVSHLDLTRFMARLIKKSKIPVWYTEGFNRHIYMNFALPLSLGFESTCEVMDIRIIDENFSNEDCLNALNSLSTEDINFFAVKEPILPTKEIGFADFELCFEQLSEDFSQKLTDFLNSESILCEKTGKKGKVKQIDLIPKIKSFSLDGKKLNICLVAGSEDNLNPSLVMDTFFAQTQTEPIFYSVTRTAILDKKGNKFA